MGMSALSRQHSAFNKNKEILQVGNSIRYQHLANLSLSLVLLTAES
jgi:hypothetical protein